MVKKNPIFLLFTCDVWKSFSSMTLRGISSDKEKLGKAKKKLKKNDVIYDIEDETYILESFDGEIELYGSYLR